MSAEKIIRNKKLYSAYKKGKKGYKKLAQEFGLAHITVRSIILREKKKEVEKVG